MGFDPAKIEPNNSGTAMMNILLQYKRPMLKQIGLSPEADFVYKEMFFVRMHAG